jgi:hypothetical protein
VSRPLIANRQTEVCAGVALLVAGAYLLWEAYEGRGHTRPFWAKLLPGP